MSMPLFSWLRRTSVKSPNSTVENLSQFADMITLEIFQELETGEQGLLGSEARERLETYGYNEVSYECPPSWYQILVRSYLNPFNILLTFLGIIYYFIGDIAGTLIIAVI